MRFSLYPFIELCSSSLSEPTVRAALKPAKDAEFDD
jgi:hypothetical protein